MANTYTRLKLGMSSTLWSSPPTDTGCVLLPLAELRSSTLNLSESHSTLRIPFPPCLGEGNGRDDDEGLR
jgi:hypothetical protein